jgi:Late competence development protein ComFB
MSNVLQNYMEQAVSLESQAMLNKIAPEMNSVIHLAEVSALALNQLPPLYVTSQEGLERLKRKYQLDLRYLVRQTARRAVTTVVQAPFRSSTPLQSEVQSEAQSTSYCWDLLQQKQKEIECLRALIVQHCPDAQLILSSLMGATQMPVTPSSSSRLSIWTMPV